MGSDLYGILQLPVPAAAAGAALGDPALDKLGAFAKAVFNAYGATAWVGMYPTQPLPVATVFANEPNEGGIDTKRLPGLFVWRSQVGTEERIADEYFVRDSVFSLAWMGTYEPDQVKRKRRATMAHAMHAALSSACRNDRDPSWNIDAKPDGTVLTKALGLIAAAKVGPMQVKRLQMQIGDGPQWFPYVELTVHVRERAFPDVSRMAALAGMNGNLKTPQVAPPTPMTIVAGHFNK